MFRVMSVSAVTCLAVASASALVPDIAAAGDSWRVEVTVTNITRGQIISPVVIASHKSGLDPLFVLGSPASYELAQVAEDAVLGPLIGALSSDPKVHVVETLFGADGPIMPGESASTVVDAPRRFRHLTVAVMLVTTNDAFFALRGVRVPWHGTRVHRSPAYDSGSEANNEDCKFIPGPPCGHPGVPAPDGAEGYVHIHGGIHGIADLNPSAHDWRNPVAEIRIRRLR